MNAQVKPATPVRVLDDVEVTRFSQVILNALQSDIDKALADLGSKYGISLSFAYGKTTDHTFNARITGYVGVNQPDSVNPKWSANFTKFAEQIGLTQEHFGKQVRNLLLKHPERETYRIVGMTPKSLDLIIENASKKYYRISIDDISFVDDEPVKAVAEVAVEEPEVVEVIEPTVAVTPSKSNIDALLDEYDDELDDTSDLLNITLDPIDE